jgi:cationic amino acid transporter 14
MWKLNFIFDVILLLSHMCIFYFCRYALAFLTPGLPFVPTIAITVNIYLIFKLSILTLVRFTVWMSLGLIMYFYYGITHSLMENPNEEIELTVDDTATSLKVPQQQNHTAVWDKHCYENQMALHDDTDDTWGTSNYYTGNSWNPSEAWGDNTTTVAGTTTTSYVQPAVVPKPSKPSPRRQPSPQPPRSSQPEAKKDGFSNLFVSATNFPSWDD